MLHIICNLRIVFIDLAFLPMQNLKLSLLSAKTVSIRLELKVKTMAQALEDSSLSVEISSVDYDEEAEDYDSLTADDAKAVIEYFFSGDQND